jgi:hypothetical protein
MESQLVFLPFRYSGDGLTDTAPEAPTPFDCGWHTWFVFWTPGSILDTDTNYPFIS